MLHCADNMEVLPTLATGSMNLIVTSPPYNIGKEYEQVQSVAMYRDRQAEVVRECVRLLADDGSICWQVGNYVVDGEVIPIDIMLYDIFKGMGLQLRNRIVWTFNHGMHCSKRLSGRHETILWFTKSKEYKFNLDPIRVPSKYPNKRHFKGPKKGQLSGNPLGKNPGDVWEIPNVKSNHVEKTDHPCQFPVELVERLVLSMTYVGDTVLDPYAGVGSSLIAAEMHRRNAVGCEWKKDYADIAQKRLSDLASGTLKTRPMGKPIHQPQAA
jgi:adenine-specific DNA-methyltransferase